jgi:hypothetical protein
MFFISAKTGTPAEMLPQFFLYVMAPGAWGNIGFPLFGVMGPHA